MKLVVGLGNPGARYASTRHNIGFLAIDALAASQGVSFSKGPGDSQTARARLGGQDIVLAKPQSYMNLSGGPVQALMTKWRVKPEDVYVVVDDVALAVGRFRARAQGSHGGHNGLRSIQECIGDRYNRLRVGCGPAPADRDLADFVLGRFTEEELQILGRRFAILEDLFCLWFDRGVDAVAQAYNGPVL